MYAYKEWEEKDIKALANIIEAMLNERYIWIHSTGTMNIDYKSKVRLFYTNVPPEIDSIDNSVTIAYENYRYNWYLQVLDEVGDEHFWWWLRVKKYLLDPSINNYEHCHAVRGRTIWEVAKYIRQNVLFRNVRLFQ